MKDEITPDAPWVFDESVTDVFDDMLARSIPQYDEMRRLVFEVGQRFVRPVGGTIVDLGSSRGEALTRFVDRFGANARFRGFDVSEPMLAAARQRFQGWEPYVTFERLDLRTGYPTPTADLTLAVLVLMFVPIEHRLRVLRNVRSHTTGAAVFVEKVLGSSADTDDLLVSETPRPGGRPCSGIRRREPPYVHRSRVLSGRVFLAVGQLRWMGGSTVTHPEITAEIAYLRDTLERLRQEHVLLGLPYLALHLTEAQVQLDYALLAGKDSR